MSYDESYVPKVDVEGIISVEIYIYIYIRKWKEITFVNSTLRIEKVLNKESCRGVKMVMCCSLNYYQHFLRQIMRLLRHEFWNKSFEDRIAHMLDIPKRLH